ncbi:GumC family protein [Sphingobacterium corticis]|uniref:non-specific protein-tyrosine kinase n=1 Tax=Sphingobacterium corticis TaxID=1812823 RepID=A0ABW5NHB2_9SPHI
MANKQTDWNDEFVDEIESSDNNDLLRFFNKILSNWYWFALCGIVGIVLAFFYLRFTVPTYTVRAKLLVSDEKKGSGGLAGSALDDFSGLMGAKSSVDNEVEVLLTTDLMQEMVLADSAYIGYYTKGALKDVPTDGAPFRVNIVSNPFAIREGVSFEIEFGEQGNLTFKDSDTTFRAQLSKPFSYPEVGTLQIEQTRALEEGEKYGFYIKPVHKAVSSLMQSLEVAVTNKNVSTIDLTLNTSIPTRGERQLNKLIQKYTDRNLNDKNVIADSTLSFIKTRLSTITKELAGVEDKISGYKQSTQLADMTEQSRLLLQNSSEYTKSIAEIDVQISSLDAVLAYLKNRDNPRVLPSSVMEQDLAFNSLITKYNGLVLERERLLLANTEGNPLVKNTDVQIAGLREDMISSLNSTKQSLELSKQKQSQMSDQLSSRIQEVPTIERGYIDLARLQQIKQEQYIFLQEKWEETAIGRTANVSNSKVIDSPRTDEYPVSPKGKIVYAFALFIALLIPLAIIYIRDLFNVRVMNFDDITNGTRLPILGSIAHSEDRDQVVITKTARSPIAEQFRAMRTNLEFTLNGGKRVLFTSSMSGEGKSYVALNLAVALALLDKKVLIMELDLRKPSITSKLGLHVGKGFSQYVVRPEMRVDEIIMPSGTHENVDLVQAGAIPPNPAELLISARATALMEELSTRYDYILMDAPPVGMVTDAQLLARYADTCLYLVRQGHTFKDQLNIPNDLVSKGKIKPIQLIVNDVKANGSYYGNYGYGYGNYGQESESKPWWKFWSNK